MANSTPASSGRTTSVPGLELVIGQLRIPFPARTFGPTAAAGLIEELRAEPAGRLSMRVICFRRWRAQARLALFQLWGQVRTGRSVVVEADGGTFYHPVDFASAFFVASDDNRAHTQRLNDAACALSVCEPAERAEALQRVLTRLTALGRQPDATGLATLTQAVEGDPVEEAEAAPTNPTILAEDFIGHYRSGLTAAPAGEPRLIHYYRGAFYRWDRVWHEVGADSMRAWVTRFLQIQAGVEKIGTKLVGDILLNLQGQSLVEVGEQPLPFLIREYGPPARIGDSRFLAFENGMIDVADLRSRTAPSLVPHDPHWFSSTALPYPFDPSARCPQFLRFLGHVLERDTESGRPQHQGDHRLEVLQEWFGYSLLPNGSFQKFLLMVGEGANGKGVILNLWTRMLGSENVSHVAIDQLGQRFGLQPLLGKVANICGDLCELDGVAEGVIKRLTGEDNITVDRKNLPLATMAPAVKLIFAANAMPRFADKSLGIWRRLMVMPFRVRIPDLEQDGALTETLTAELPGILNWALDGLSRLLTRGRFTACPTCVAAADRHRFDCDPVAQFIDEEFPQGIGPNRRILVDEMYRRYGEWCKQSGHLALSKIKLNKQVWKLPGIGQIREGARKRPYVWTGIGDPIPAPPVPFRGQAEAGDAVQNG